MGETRVYISIDEKVLGYFNFKNQYREGFSEVVSQLQTGHKSVSILSGDNDKEKIKSESLLGSGVDMRFNRPTSKMQYMGEPRWEG